ncbi:hypothetical protein [Streptomyces sp. NBC_00233]|uniref:hypothetical protein n=1 Tax=Streptomyces sp. NBC_00233 TaxID=2975686 RepID=UPI0022560286|nr:hypothetical protein [Streptomyces sp. NBC_00233]MCX5230880.1 hypothetical protein [Streptomyces sp. NBC_00233]
MVSDVRLPGVRPDECRTQSLRTGLPLCQVTRGVVDVLGVVLRGYRDHQAQSHASQVSLVRGPGERHVPVLHRVDADDGHGAPWYWS